MTWLTDRLATLLPERNLTVEALAQRLAIERSRLNAIMTGAALPNANLVKRLARGLGENAEEWLAHTGKTEEGPPVAEVPMGFLRVAAVSEVPDGEMKIVCDDRVVVAKVGGRFYAFGNLCPHAGGRLGEGFLDAGVVECPWHAGQWDIATGKGLTAFATADIPVYAVRVVGDDIELRLGNGDL